MKTMSILCLCEKDIYNRFECWRHLPGITSKPIIMRFMRQDKFPHVYLLPSFTIDVGIVLSADSFLFLFIYCFIIDYINECISVK
jgi:hypothetical protein